MPRKSAKEGKKRSNVSPWHLSSMLLEEEVPIVIGKAASPRCFKGIKDKRNPLGVPYYSNRKAWMNSEIMLDVLSKVNRQLVREKRKVILFLDNVSSHSPELADKLSNIKVIFLPKNTTSRLQPLDAGIIKNFKAHYRKLMLKHTLAQIGSASLTASDVVKKKLMIFLQFMGQASLGGS